jgi:hypothetical protein
MRSNNKKYVTWPLDSVEQRVTVLRLKKLSLKDRVRALRTEPNHYPRFLYKYLSPDMPAAWLEDILVESSLYLNSPTRFNDPFDLKAHLVYEGKIQEKRKRWEEIVKNNDPGLTKSQRERKISELMASKSNSVEHLRKVFDVHTGMAGISSFSEEAKNLLMWSHYSRMHKGIVLQFDIFQDLDNLLPIMKVQYSREYPTINFTKNFGAQLGPVMLRKSPDWAYEKEWRLVYIGGANSYLKFKPEALSGLIFGSKIEPTFRNRIERLLRKRTRNNLPSLDKYQAVLSLRNYEIKVFGEKSLENISNQIYNLNSENLV